MATSQIFRSLRLPVLAAPMFLVSTLELVKACCKAGIGGTFPALNQRSSEGFESWLVELKSDLPAEAVWGVNLIVHRSNPRMRADLELCVEHEVPLVITSLGAAKDVVDAVHGYGGVVFHDITNLRHAQKAAAAGVDGLILVAGGAGGHAGTINPFALVAEIRAHFSGTIVLAGCISSGRDVLAVRALGADLAYMGTRFIATAESNALPEYKQMILDARAGDIVHTPAVSGVPANFMRQSLEQNGFDMERLFDPAHVNFGEKLTMNDEAKAWKTVWSAGHGVSAIDDIPTVGELVDRLQAEYQQAKAGLG